MAATVGYWSCAAKLLPSISMRPTFPRRNYSSSIVTMKLRHLNRPPIFLYCSSSNASAVLSSSSESEGEEEEDEMSTTLRINPPIKKKRRYRKQYPGENKGITEEMRFVAMKLRNSNFKVKNVTESDISAGESDNDASGESISSPEGETEDEAGDGKDGRIWQPSMEGFLKYLVDSKLVFDTIDRIVDEYGDVSYAYFRKTGLERAEGLSKDLEWFSQQDYTIPEPSNPGITYAKYLEELAERSPPLFLCHFYNIYFSHIAGGQVIARQVSETLLEGKELEFYRWEGDVEDLLKSVREKLNQLGEYWFRDQKNRCLREATKSFRLMGQIVRLIIL